MLMPYAHWIKMVPSHSIARRSSLTCIEKLLFKWIPFICALYRSVRFPASSSSIGCPLLGSQEVRTQTTQCSNKIAKEISRRFTVKIRFSVCLRIYLFSVCARACVLISAWKIQVLSQCQLCAFGILLWANYSYYIFIFIISFSFFLVLVLSCFVRSFFSVLSISRRL